MTLYIYGVNIIYMYQKIWIINQMKNIRWKTNLKYQNENNNEQLFKKHSN